MIRGWTPALLAALACVAGGCGLGKNRMLMVTKTNIGIAAETTPQPNAEISIARSEALIAPVFGEGVTPAAIAGVSVAADSGAFDSGIGSAFAVGDAALTLTDVGAAADGQHDATLRDVRLHAADAEPPGWIGPMLKPRAVYFATDTAFGIKAVWGGTAGPYPDRVIVGYNRKEGTLAPLQAAAQDDAGVYTIDAPSLIATVNAGAGATPRGANGAPTSATFKHQQFFATGDAATRLGRLREVRESVFRQIDSELADAIVSLRSDPIECADELGAWIDADGANFAALRSFLEGAGYEGSPTVFIETGVNDELGERVCAWFNEQTGAN
ncbi:MAG: hypothetical protein AAFO89_04775 [Planctomycetota bacterium]